jgi:hypothetical protein
MATTETPSRGNVLTRKIGPLPTWAWTGIILTPIVIYGLIKRKSSTAAASTASGGTGTMTDASQVPQFVNQTFVSPSPPAAPGTVAPPVTVAPVTPTIPPVGQPPTAAPPVVPPTASMPGTVAIPNVVGERANFAIGKLKSSGFPYKSASGSRIPTKTYVVTGEQPAGGTRAAKGTPVTLTWKPGL